MYFFFWISRWVPRIYRQPNLSNWPHKNKSSLPVSASPLLTPSLPVLYVSETHFVQSLHSLASSFTCSQIYFPLSLFPGQPPFPPSISPIFAAALLAQWQSHHTLSIRLVRPGRSAAQHLTVLVWSHQRQSVSLALSVTLKRFRLPDIVCFPPALSQVRSCGGGGAVGWAWVKIQLSARFDITWHILWTVSALKWAISLWNKDGCLDTWKPKAFADTIWKHKKKKKKKKLALGVSR